MGENYNYSYNDYIDYITFEYDKKKCDWDWNEIEINYYEKKIKNRKEIRKEKIKLYINGL